MSSGSFMTSCRSDRPYAPSVTAPSMTFWSEPRTADQSRRSTASTSSRGSPSNDTGAHKSTPGGASPALLPTAAADASRPLSHEHQPRICSQKWLREEIFVSGPYRNRTPLKPSSSPADFQSEHSRREGLNAPNHRSDRGPRRPHPRRRGRFQRVLTEFDLI